MSDEDAQQFLAPNFDVPQTTQAHEGKEVDQEKNLGLKRKDEEKELRHHRPGHVVEFQDHR
jgi:hypothetical protein